jgi:hypothetical protein
MIKFKIENKDPVNGKVLIILKVDDFIKRLQWIQNQSIFGKSLII